MKNKSFKFIFVLTALTLITGATLLCLSERSRTTQAEKKFFLRLNKNAEPIIRGFQYSKYHEGRKALNIKAAKFSVEKKKIGIFQLAPFKVVMFKDAEIDFFGETDRPNQKKDQPQNALNSEENGAAVINSVSFKGMLSEEMMPPSALKGGISAICEPVKIILYLDEEQATKIYAEKATLDPQRRRMILHGKIKVTSGTSQLSTNRLAIYPETGLFDVEDTYVLKTHSGTVTGEKLSTDFFLEKVRIQ